MNDEIVAAALDKAFAIYNGKKYTMSKELRLKFIDKTYNASEAVQFICAKYLNDDSSIISNANMTGLMQLAEIDDLKLITIDILRNLILFGKIKYFIVSEKIENIVAMLVSRYIPTKNLYMKKYITLLVGAEVAEKAYTYNKPTPAKLPNFPLTLHSVSAKYGSDPIRLYWANPMFVPKFEDEYMQYRIYSIFPTNIFEVIKTDYVFLHYVDMPANNNASQIRRYCDELETLSRHVLIRNEIANLPVTSIKVDLKLYNKLVEEYSPDSHLLFTREDNLLDSNVKRLLNREYIFDEIYSHRVKDKKFIISSRMKTDTVIKFSQ